MQLKKPMEFTRNQNDQLNRLKGMLQLHELQAKYENNKKDLESLITERSESLNKREMLMERLLSLQEELQNARKEEYNWQLKLEAANTSFVDDTNDNLQSICLLLGYQIPKCQLLENNELQMTLYYRDICYITFNEIGQMFDLIAIFPQHPHFPQIREFLQKSQDLRGLLSCLRKFFDYALECKQTKEQ